MPLTSAALALGISFASVDLQRVAKLVALHLEVIEADLSVVVGGVQIGERGKDRGLIRLPGRWGRIWTFVWRLLGPFQAPLELGLLLGLLVAVALQLAEGRPPSCHA
jgi:hypothetical protein